MNAEFFALAFTAALNPKLLAIDLLLIENRRSRAMFLCLLLGGLTVALTIGLLDVLVLHADALKAQGAQEQRVKAIENFTKFLRVSYWHKKFA